MPRSATKEKMDLKKRWLALWKHIGGKTDGEAEWAEIVLRYTEPHRAYHVLAHIEHCLRELDDVRVKRLLMGPAAVEVALGLHDIINDTDLEAVKRKDNEEKSAKLWLKMAHDGSIPEVFANHVVQLILPTSHDNTVAYSHDGFYVLDIDLAILGRPALEFDNYEDQVRSEYAWASDEDFAKGRRSIIAGFLARPYGIYLTQFFRDKYEKQAQRNLRYSVACLSDRLDARAF